MARFKIAFTLNLSADPQMQEAVTELDTLESPLLWAVVQADSELQAQKQLTDYLNSRLKIQVIKIQSVD